MDHQAFSPQTRAGGKLDFPPDISTTEEFFLDTFRDCPALLSLSEQYGVMTVFHGGVKCLGWPPSWCPSGTDLIKLSDYLECNHGTET